MSEGVMVVSRLSGVVFTVFSVLGLVSSFLLMLETWRVAGDPLYVPACSINDILSCGSVMVAPQSALFGVPNPVFGLMMFSAVGVVGVLMVGGVRFPSWFSWLLVGVLSGAVVTVHYFAYLSMVVLGSLCPYCLVVWAVTIPLFVMSVKMVVDVFRGGVGSWFSYVVWMVSWLVIVFGVLVIVFL